MDFINDDAAEAYEEFPRLGLGEQQRQAFGRGQQNMGRCGALPGAAIGGRIAGAGFNANGQCHAFNRRHQIARDIHRQRLERRDVERMQPFARRRGQIHQRRQKTGEGLAAARRRHQQRVISRCHGIQNIKLMRPRLPAARRKPAGKRFW